MRSSLRKVSLLILLIIVLPVMIFSVFEIGNLRQNEKVIQNIYKNQLDAILFSINQYSDDIVSNLASRIENNLNNYKIDSEGLNKIINEFQVNSLIHFNKKLEFISSEPYSGGDSTLASDIKAKIENNFPVIEQLHTYLKGGYRKIISIGNTGKDLQCIVFLTLVKNEEIINVLVIDPVKFISRVLDPRIQEIAKGKFHIAAYQIGRAHV